ncbi:MAG: hypothetical protein HUU23_02020 [Caldilineales bacterium]|nr:hypothetical protein [Caldilineales bacterium]
MTESATQLQDLGREALIGRLTARLRLLDDAELAALELRTRPPALAGSDAASPPPPSPAHGEGMVTRRQFLRTSLGVGALGLATTAGVGYAAWEWGGMRQRTAAELAFGAEILKLRGLLVLYEQLENAGLDDLAAAALVAADRSLRLVERGATALQAGAERAEAALLDLEIPFAAIQEGILWVEARVTALAGALQRLEDALAQVLQPARPLVAAIAAFADRLLGLLPFGVGEPIRRGIAGMAEVLASVPELVEGVNERLLQPLRTRWFTTDPETGLFVRLIDQVVTGLLDPVEAHLATVAETSANWQQQLALPLRAALDERSALRAEILRFSGESGG